MHVDGLDRFRTAWAGHRILERLADGGTNAVAWVAADDRDGCALAVRVGARGVIVDEVHAHEPRADRAVRLRGVVEHALDASRQRTHRPAVPHPDADAVLAAWFATRYASVWQPWVEHAAAVVVGGGERTEQAEALRRALCPATSEHALRRLRQINEMLCGEIRGNEAVLRRESLVVLRKIARLRPLVAEPHVTRSLQRAARLLAADPALATEAGLATTQVADLIEVAAAEVEAAVRPVKRRGRPEAGAWRSRRSQALGRVAERRGQTAAEKLQVLALLAGALDTTLHAVYDALEDRERTSA